MLYYIIRSFIIIIRKYQLNMGDHQVLYIVNDMIVSNCTILL